MKPSHKNPVDQFLGFIKKIERYQKEIQKNHTTIKLEFESFLRENSELLKKNQKEQKELVETVKESLESLLENSKTDDDIDDDLKTKIDTAKKEIKKYLRLDEDINREATHSFGQVLDRYTCLLKQKEQAIEEYRKSGTEFYMASIKNHLVEDIHTRIIENINEMEELKMDDYMHHAGDLIFLRHLEEQFNTKNEGMEVDSILETISNILLSFIEKNDKELFNLIKSNPKNNNRQLVLFKVKESTNKFISEVSEQLKSKIDLATIFFKNRDLISKIKKEIEPYHSSEKELKNILDTLNENIKQQRNLLKSLLIKFKKASDDIDKTTQNIEKLNDNPKKIIMFYAKSTLSNNEAFSKWINFISNVDCHLMEKKELKTDFLKFKLPLFSELSEDDVKKLNDDTIAYLKDEEEEQKIIAAIEAEESSPTYFSYVN